MSMSDHNPDSPETIFRVDRAHLLAAIFMAALALLISGAAFTYLFWVPFLPLVMIYYVLRSRTVITTDGITAYYAFKRPATMPWAEFTGLGFQGSRALAFGSRNKKMRLPGISFNSLPKLEKASFGRIPDVITKAHQAADDQVVIINKDGHQVLISKDEYDARIHSDTADND
ncbi:PH domain-containing protein [Corynebacterium sp. ES2775-CONJ]|uniref:PH domain-containing protein n=1 Tax=Corynebacterium sp. ES2775-CONJ TaxID=2974029 RepID=UPI0021674D78|nr:PH domain-containing protein [Corynebacterium sp. ES2775-CONJ]MCS4489780.1 PH domain-containing protein [Corynebacterium sp. ES2775-CONJ]